VRNSSKLLCNATGCLLVLLLTSVSSAQPPIRISSAAPPQQINAAAFQQGGLAPVPPAGVQGGFNAQLAQPQFDPFSTHPQAANSPPMLVAPPQSNAPGFGPQGFAPPPQFQQQPPVLYPNGYGLDPGSSAGWGPNGALAQPTPGPYLRLFQDLRLTHTFLAGDPESETRDLQINDSELATTMNFPNFLWTGQPLRLSPGFIFHSWSGPRAGGPPADLPSRAYSAYLNGYMTTNLDRLVGAEVDVTGGVFSDFNTLTSDSVRVFGTGLVWFRLNPTVTIKGGVEYLDRVDLKLLPAGGIFWRPNQDYYFELYFPRPRFGQRVTALGNYDVWFYLGGEYGGGSWTVERAVTGISQRVDINDIRIFAGFEWTGRVTPFRGFAEAGYVFERELVYAGGPENVFINDTFMLRGGLIY